MILYNNNINIAGMQQNYDENLKNFGKVIKKIRKEKSKSLTKLAFTRGGVTSATLSRIENGLVDFKFSTLLNLAYTLNVSLIDIFKDFDYRLDIDK